MPVEVGAVLEGKVTGITKFGAFIDLGGGASGLCHISEIADTYVREVSDHIQEKQAVTVKVISIDERGKVNLSIRQAVKTPQTRPASGNGARKLKTFREYDNNRDPREYRSRQNALDFEDMLSSFLKETDDKLRDVKKQKNNRRGNGHSTNW